MATHFGRSWRCSQLICSAPLVVNVCTKRNQLSLALTFEENSFVSKRIEMIKAILRNLLASGRP
jgi:hypothetical protein